MQSFSQFLSQAGEDSIVTTAPCRADLAGGTIDIWPLYLFHPGAVSVNIALGILTACKITPRAGREIVLRSHDIEREDRFACLEDLLTAKSYAHPLAAYLVRFFRPDRRLYPGNSFRIARGRGHLRFVGPDDRHQRRAGPLCRTRNRD